MTEGFTTHEEDIALAGEYVLGVLGQSERAAVDRRIKTDAAFAALVSSWEKDLSGMNAGFAEVPAPDVLARVEERLFGKTEPVPAWPLRRLWRLGLGAGLAAIVAILALLVWQPTQGFHEPVLTATLAAEGQPLSFAARWDPEARELVVMRTSGPAASPGTVHELWVIAGQGQAPVSLGLLEGSELRRPLEALPNGAILAVSLEPTGGSPTGAPTGPVLVTGLVGI